MVETRNAPPYRVMRVALCQRAKPRTSMGRSNSTGLHVFPREFINHQLWRGLVYQTL